MILRNKENQKIDKVYRYPDGITPKVVDGFRVIDITIKNDRGIEFCEKPRLPVHFGELWHRGWDIPTVYAIDANKQCWVNNSHGGNLHKVKPKILLKMCEDDKNKNFIEHILGLNTLTNKCSQCGK